MVCPPVLAREGVVGVRLRFGSSDLVASGDQSFALEIAGHVVESVVEAGVLA